MVSLISKVFLGLNAAILTITIVFNSLSAQNGYLLEHVFHNRTTGEIANKVYPLQILPAGATFSIWGVIYVWQVLWVIYTLSFLCRGNAPDVLKVPFCMSFIISCLVNVGWLVVWSALEDIWAMIFLFLTTASLYSALVFAHRAIGESEGALEKTNRLDLILLRALLLNGIALYATWTTIASMINFAVVLKYSAGLSDSAASCTALGFLLAILLVWFVLQNFVLKRYLAYTFSTWPVVIVALTGIIAKNWNPALASSQFSATLLALAVSFFIARITLGVYRLLRARKSMMV